MSDSASVDGSLSSQVKETLTFSMDFDPDTPNNIRKYPSIGDYYRASSKDSSRPIQLQNGLSNYSGLVLGDDRISFTESILSATYRIPVEEKMAIESPSKHKTKHSRKRDYQDAYKKVGDTEINRLERVMKDKLFQRSYATSSPFQVRKAFKFFDREQSLRIAIEGFTRALEFLGFQFSELQNLALFARYDPDFTGEIDYMNFINTAMFYAAVEPDFGVHPKTPTPKHADLGDSPDLAANELKLLQEAELKKIFNKVDRDRRGAINKDDLELLLMALGHTLSARDVDACVQDIGVSGEGNISFELFFDWWTSDIGVAAIRKKINKK
eukprot:gene5600-7729_t